MNRDIGVVSQRCGCGALLVPPKSVSSIGKQRIEEVYPYPELEPTIDTASLPEGLAEKEDEIAKLESEYAAERAVEVARIKGEAQARETELKVISKAVTFSESDAGTKLDIERLELLVEGSFDEGLFKLKCPKCGVTTFEWRKPAK